tara:strand:- start:1995 stop:2744 length:750 start_codon:yes stop_codon:yes gene_type:complete
VSILSSKEDWRHSASKIKTMSKTPQQFMYDQIFDIERSSNDLMKRGNVTELIAQFILGEDRTDEEILDYAKATADDYELEDRLNVGWSILCAREMVEELEKRQLSKIENYQEEFRDHLKDFKFYQLGYSDFTFKDITVDLKSKSRMPNNNIADFGDVLQQSFYWGLSGKKRRFALLYATPKKSLFIEIPKKELMKGWEICLHNMRLIEKLDDMCKTKQDWLDLFPYPDVGTFYYSDDDYVEKINKLYNL